MFTQNCVDMWNVIYIYIYIYIYITVSYLTLWSCVVTCRPGIFHAQYLVKFSPNTVLFQNTAGLTETFSKLVTLHIRRDGLPCLTFYQRHGLNSVTRVGTTCWYSTK